jgi:hypothetical protein
VYRLVMAGRRPHYSIHSGRRLAAGQLWLLQRIENTERLPACVCPLAGESVHMAERPGLGVDQAGREACCQVADLSVIVSSNAAQHILI